jgi:heat shock protein HtpX
MNRLKVTFLLTCLTLLLVAMGSAIGGQSGLFIAFALACGMMKSSGPARLRASP